MPAHSSLRDVQTGRISLLDHVGNSGAHALALQASKNRLLGAREMQIVLEHHRLALDVHRTMIAVVLARNKASQDAGLYVPAQRARRHEHAGDADVSAIESAAPPVSAVASKKKRKAAARALAGAAEVPTHDAEGLPLAPSGKFLSVIYNKSGTFGARITSRGKTTNLGVFPEAILAARAIQHFKKTGEAPKLSRSDAAKIGSTRLFAKRVDAHNSSAAANGKHVFDLQARLLTCPHCHAEYPSTSFSHATRLLCPRLAKDVGKSVDERGSHTRAATLSATRNKAFLGVITAHNRIAPQHGWHLMSTAPAGLSQPQCTVCMDSVTRNYARKWMRRPCPGG